MSENRKLAQLMFKDNFMFGAVMADEEICRDFLEMAVGIPIEKVEISKEKSMIYHPEYHGIRLDIIARDEKRTHYNVEMQVAKKSNLGKRARYYHSQMDMELLLTGDDYAALPASYVIFICDFDPFGSKKYRYTFQKISVETGEPIDDGSISIFLSTCGKNETEVPAGLVNFLKFVKADLRAVLRTTRMVCVKKIQESMARIKRQPGNGGEVYVAGRVVEGGTCRGRSKRAGAGKN